MRWMIGVALMMCLSAHAETVPLDGRVKEKRAEDFPAHRLLVQSWEADGDTARRAEAQRAFVTAIDRAAPESRVADWWMLQAWAVNAERELGAFDAAIARIDRLSLIQVTGAENRLLKVRHDQTLKYFKQQRVAIARRDTTCAEPCGDRNLKRPEPARPPPPPGYNFPARLTERPGRCGRTRSPTISFIEMGWYPWHWWSAGEPALYPRSRSRSGAAERTYRFTWLRSFRHPVIVRLDEKDGGVWMTATELSGMGGSADVAAVERRVARRLASAEVRELNWSLRRAALLIQPIDDCSLIFDGARWVVEANDRGRYLYLVRHSPKDGPVRDLGMTMLRLTGWTFGDVY